jgi:hypothetical protein
MRKKNPPGASTTLNTAISKKRSTSTGTSRKIPTQQVPTNMEVEALHTANEMVDDVSSSGGPSRERSSSPLESDLLKYLTAHIAPPSGDYDMFHAVVTSFSIGRNEYLEGIVRLVQSDCPEVACDMQSFVGAMKQAFSDVSGVKPIDDAGSQNH